MNTDRLGAACYWTIVAAVFAGTVWFGAVEDQIRYLLFALAIVASIGVIVTADNGSWVGRRSYWLLAAFPLWIVLSLVPLPSAVIKLLNPESARVWDVVAPGSMLGCLGVLPAADSRFRSLTLDGSESWQFLFQVVAALMVFWAAASSADRAPHRRQILLWALALFGAAEATYGLVQWLSSSPMVLWYEKEAYKDSATGTLINRNHFAMLLYLSMGALLTLARTPARQHGQEASRAEARQITLVVIFAVLLAGLVASKSRAGLALGLLVIASGASGLWRGARRPMRLVSGALGLLIALPALWVSVPALVERASQVGVDWSDPQSRGAVLRLSADTIARYPVFGTGAGTFSQTFTFYRPKLMQVRYQEAHNDYLQVWVETGLIGLALAVAPVIAVGARVLSARKQGGLSAELPVWVSLGVVALHEAVDFPLRIPSLVLLVALIAGLFLPKSSRAIVGAGESKWLLAGAGVLAPLCLLYGVAQWESLGGAVPWPKLAERTYREVVGLTERAKQESNPQLLCEALAKNAEVQRARPLSGTYAIRQARLLLAAAEAGALSSSVDPDAVKAEVARAAERARRVDAWNTNLVRYPLVAIELSLGQPDRALEDAEVVCALNSELAPGIVEDLYRAGFPPQTLAARFMPYGSAIQRVLQLVLEDGDLETAGAIIPADIKASPSLCRSGGEVRQILELTHSSPAIAFLEGCLALPTVAAWHDTIRIWIARDLLAAKKWDEASRALPAIKDEATKKMFEIEIARARRDWPAVRRTVLRLLDLRGSQADETETYLYCILGDSLAHTSDFSGAINAYEKAISNDPTAEHIRKRLSDLKLGVLPE